jgi:hypothetical protein
VSTPRCTGCPRSSTPSRATRTNGGGCAPSRSWRWADPDAFDLGRGPSGHVGFAIHQSVGQHVARLEAEALLTALARRVAGLELAGPTKRHHNNTLRAWESIPVRMLSA